MKHWGSLFLLISLFTGIASCGGGGEPGAPPDPVATVSVSPSTASLTVGQAQQLTAVLRDAGGAELSGRVVTWTTSDAGVATVSSSGLVSALAVGSATIHATSEGLSGSATVSVAPMQSHTFSVVATGGAHTCALTSDGAAYCWGRDESGQLGAAAPASCSLDSGVFPCALIPTAVNGGLTFSQITAGGSHTCGLTADGSAYCWGNDVNGQLGDNAVVSQQRPVAVATGLRFTQIDAGTNHTCGVTSGGSAYCWGSNTRGQLGDGSVTDRGTPVAVSGGIGFQMIAAGGFDIGHTCGLVTDGSAYCWGDNELGQLGNGTTDVTAHPAPVTVAGGFSFTSLTTGLDRHTCGLVSSGAAYCWGENAFGALGDGTTTARTTPVPVLGNLVFAELKAGGFIGHTCGITTGGVAYCWGENERGAIGDGTTTDRFSPVAVAGDLRFTGIDAGFRHTCGVTDASVLYCWGSGGAGQLGTNATSQSSAPVKVVGQP